MRRLLAGMVAAAIIGIVASSTAAADGNVGKVNHFTPGLTFDAAGNLVSYTCAYVHRTVVPGGFQDKQTCRLADGAALPKKPVTLTDPSLWASDFMLMTGGGIQIATTWSQTIMPSGQVVIVSFYAVP